MTRWFRFYDDAVNDPKVQRLPADLFKSWINILCLASQRDGVLPPIEDIEFSLRLPRAKVERLIEELIQRELLDGFEDGTPLRPHNWDGRQHKSDCSTGRVKQFRERKLKQDETVSETPPDTEQNRTETERISRKSRENVWPDDYEDRFWREYPRKVGKQAAVKKLRTIWKSDRVSWDVLLAAVRLYAKDCEGKDPQYVAHPATWLNAGRWEDEIPEGARVFAAAVPDAESIAHKAKIAIKMELHDKTGAWPSLDEIERVYAERAA